MDENQRAQPDGLDLLVIGDCNPDVLVLGEDVRPAFGQQEKLVGGISLVVGGSAAITAVAAARLGLRVALVAAIGADPAGDFMLGQLASEGVQTSGLKVAADSATGMTVALSHGGDRAILTALGAMPALTSADVPAALLTRARHVHVSSYFLLETLAWTWSCRAARSGPRQRRDHLAGHQLGSGRSVGRRAAARGAGADRRAAPERGGGVPPQRPADRRRCR